MDHRKTNVKDLSSLNKYLQAMDLEEYRLTYDNQHENRLCFVGNGQYGHADTWEYNSFPKELLKQITYADWVDLFFIVSDKEWHFPTKHSKKR